MRASRTIPFLFYVVLFQACIERFIIPNDLKTGPESDFGAGDTTYLLLGPVWNESYGLQSPVEISVSQDGRIFVADSGLHSIIVFNQNGERPNGFDGLLDLTDENLEPLVPIDVDIDNKMNIFFIVGDQRVYIWNQYWNSVGVNKISISGTFTHLQTGVVQDAISGTDTWIDLLNNVQWQLSNVIMSDDQLMIDSIMAPHIFYDGRYEKNHYLDPFYDSDSSRFTGLSAPAGQENMIFVTDDYGGEQNQYRVLQINFQRSLLLELATGENVWCFTGIFGATVKGYGTGSGSVNQPLSLDVDYQGNLYYAQAGNYFPVHMISPNLSGDFAVYTSGFQPGLHDIMTGDWYASPQDVAVDADRNIYVANSGDQDILVFGSNGAFFKKAGIEEFIIDTTINIWSVIDTSSVDTTLVLPDSSQIDTTFHVLVYDSVSVDTFVAVEAKGLLASPSAVAVDNRGIIYVCDPERSSIVRFSLSNVLDDDLQLEN